MEVLQPPLQDVKLKKKAKKKKPKVTNNNITKENDEGEERLVSMTNGVDGDAGVENESNPDDSHCKNNKNTDDLINNLTNHIEAIKLAKPINGLVKKLVNGEHNDATIVVNDEKLAAITEPQSTGAVKKAKKKHKNKKQKAPDKSEETGQAVKQDETNTNSTESSTPSQISMSTTLPSTGFGCICSHHAHQIKQLPVVTSGEPKIVIDYKEYESELQMPDIMHLIQKDLSEPYSIYTYRYFIHNWPNLCFLAYHETKCVGAIVCKLDMHKGLKRGYIAMLAVDKEFRKLKIGTTLVQKAINVS